MSKKKVTLSIESKIYDDFQSFCEENAIMLSKKIEIFMKNSVKHKKIVTAFMLSLLLIITLVGALQFSDSIQSDFSNGTHQNTTNNTTGVYLFGANTSGVFTSRIFSAGSLALLGNISVSKNLPSSEYLYTVDGAADVWVSNNSGLNWTLVKDDYNGAFSNGATNILRDNINNFYIIDGPEIWKSIDSGVSWSKIQDDYNGAEGQNPFVSLFDKNNTFLIIEGDQDVWVSNNSGLNWTKRSDDFNGGNGNFGGFAVNASNILFAVDLAADVWVSNNSGLNWTLVKDDYNGAFSNNADSLVIDTEGSLFILDSQRIWKSTNGGFNWININSDFNGAGDSHSGITMTITSNNSLVVIDSGQEAYFSSDGGLNFSQQSLDFNNGNPNVAGIISIPKRTNITLQFRNCSSYCTNEPFLGPDYSSNTSFSEDFVSNINLTGRFFQYKSYFTSDESGLSPVLFNISMDYTLLDTNPPVISIISPQNTSYNSSSLFLNYTVTDASSISSCKFSIDGGTNISLPSCSTASISTGDGNHILLLYANDSIGNSNYSSVAFHVDSTAPTWINMVNSAPISYNSNLTLFNVTWTDTNSVSPVLFESNFSGVSANYTMNLISTNKYGFNATIPAGTFYWRSYAFDSLGNFNVTSSQTFTIQKAQNSLDLYINGNQNQNVTASYGSNLNVTASGLLGDITLFRNGQSISNPDTSSLGAGIYTYEAFISETQNISSANKTYTLNITKANPNITLLVNGLASNASISYSSLSNISVQEFNNGDSDVIYTLYRNGVALGTGSLSDIQTLSAGNYTYVYNSTQGSNYTSSSLSFTLNVNKASPSFELLINGVDSDISLSAGSLANINASLTSPSAQLVNLYENEILIDTNIFANASKNYSNPGDFVWKVNFTGNENYTFGEKIHTISIIDPSAPQFSQLTRSPASPATYSSSARYQFNVTWTDNVGISDVIMQFNNINYSYANGQLNRTGDEYSFNIDSLPASTYSYRWYANDTSNTFTATSPQSYVVEKAITALFLTITPSGSVTYGSITSAGCSANNPESILSLTRNVALVSNPDTNDLAAGNYNYACTASSTQNYTSASITGTLNIAKATPIINLTLNGYEDSITIASSSADVNISAFAVAPLFGTINLTLNGELINSGSGLLENLTSLISEGNYPVTSSYAGNENYTSYTLTRSIILQNPTPPVIGGGGGGRGGGGGSSAVIPLTSNQDGKLEFSNLGDVIMYPGETKTLELTVKNGGKTFLNKCALMGKGEYSNWFVTGETKNINIGEITEYIFSLKVPINATMQSSPELELQCLEQTISVPLEIIILKSGINVEIKNMEIIDGSLSVNYTLIGDSSFTQDLIFVVSDEKNNIISEKQETVQVKALEKTHNSILLDISDAEQGLLKVSVKKAENKDVSLVDEFFVYQSSKGITGFASLGAVNTPAGYTIITIIIFAVIAFFIVRRIWLLKRTTMYGYQSNFGY